MAVLMTLTEDIDVEIDFATIAGGAFDFANPGGTTSDANYARLSYRIQNTSRHRSRRTITPVTEFWFHSAINITTAATLNAIVWSARSKANSDTDQFRLIYSSSPNTFQFQRNNAGSFVSLGSAFTIGLNALRTIDIYCKIDASSGVFEFYLDGSLVASFSGAAVQTQHNVVDSFTLGAPASGGTGTATHWSECVVADENTIGWRVKSMAPTANGTHTDFSNSYTAIDEQVYDAVDFANSNTVTNRSTYAMGDLNAGDSARIIKAVIIDQVIMRTSDATPTDADALIRSGGTTVSAATLSLATGVNYRQTILATNPVTTSSWTYSDVNAVEMGIEAT